MRTAAVWALERVGDARAVPGLVEALTDNTVREDVARVLKKIGDARAVDALIDGVTVAMKISQNLERVGDEATTIARRALELNAEPQLKPYVDIPKMADTALEMLKEALDSFVTRDPARARAVIPRDKEVDSLNKQLHRELASFMIEQPPTITRCLNLMVVSKSLERIADHATNIAEEVVYVYEGRDIRHMGEGKVRPLHAPEMIAVPKRSR